MNIGWPVISTESIFSYMGYHLVGTIIRYGRLYKWPSVKWTIQYNNDLKKGSIESSLWGQGQFYKLFEGQGQINLITIKMKISSNVSPMINSA